MTYQTLTIARDLVQQLTYHEKLILLNDITVQLLGAPLAQDPPPRPPFPVLHLTHWPADIPLRREELYDDTGR